MIDKSFLVVKLDLVKKYASDLERILENPIEGIRKDFVAIYAVERIFQLIVDEILTLIITLFYGIIGSAGRFSVNLCGAGSQWHSQ